MPEVIIPQPHLTYSIYRYINGDIEVCGCYPCKGVDGGGGTFLTYLYDNISEQHDLVCVKIIHLWTESGFFLMNTM